MKKMVLGLTVVLSAALLFTGCKKESGETVTVQSVGMITGTGSVGVTERFAGIVSARSETKVKADSQKKILDILVQEGDEVALGDVLFTYDMEAYELSLEKAELELDQMKNSLSAAEKEKEQLEKEKAKAGADAQLSYTLEIEALATSIREQEYNIALKEKEVGRLRESLEISEVTAPIAGRVKKINNPNNGGNDLGAGYGYGEGADDSLMTIVEAGAYRIKGYVNENNAGAMMEGMPVIIRSRMDENVTWNGTVSEIVWEGVQDTGNNNYYGETASEMESSSKFPFYVELDDSEGLLLGQHVYIEQNMGQDTAQEGLNLPEYYLTEVNGDMAYVWAQAKNGKLEKRAVSLGEYNEESGTYVVLFGITETDFIAYPDETLKEGMKCEEFDPNAFDPGVDGGYEDGGFYEDGMPEDGGFYEEGMPEDGGFYEEGMPEDGGFYDEALPEEDLTLGTVSE